MKKTVVRTISTILVLVLSMLTFSSCGVDFFGTMTIAPGYTGGFGISYGSQQEYWWVETYDECMEAIELLESHGSTLIKTDIFTYEGDLFDTKYYFSMHGDLADKHVKYGGNPFDRKVNNVVVGAVAFYDDVEIDDLVFTSIGRYKAYRIETIAEYILNDNQYLSAESFQCTSITGDTYMLYEYRVKNEDSLSFAIRAYNKNAEPLPDEAIEAMINSLVIVGNTDFSDIEKNKKDYIE